jgi:hypothetical protein
MAPQRLIAPFVLLLLLQTHPEPDNGGCRKL